jgi:hypothetical protein
MQHAIHAALKRDRAARTARIGESIVAELAEGNVHEAFRHLKGWYREASETQARPCFQTMERQMEERVELYRRHDSPGLPIVLEHAEMRAEIRDDTPDDEEIRAAVAELTNGHSAGVSRMRAEHLKGWLNGVKLEENPKTGPANVGAGADWESLVQLVQAADWEALVQLVQAVWDEGRIPTQLGWVVTVLIPKGGGDYRGIGLLEPIWKVIERVIDKRLEAIALHDSLHGCHNGRGTGTAVIEAKLSQQLAHIEQTPFYGVFIDLKKALDAMDGEHCLLLLEGHGASPNMRGLIRHFWDKATNVCRASGNYGTPFKAGRGVTQGGPLSAELFNVLVDAVVMEWLRLLREKMVMEDEELDGMMATLFTILYVDDAYIASRDPINGLVSAFERVGLETNIKKTQAMTCMPGTIRLQLPTKSYLRMRTGRTPAVDWDACTVTCREWGKDMRASFLGRHLADQYEIYQMQVVAEELLCRRDGVVYEVPLCCGKLKCPFPLCKGELASGWMMRRHFPDLHLLDYVVVKTPPPSAHLSFSGGKKNIKFYFRKKRGTRKNSSVS